MHPSKVELEKCKVNLKNAAHKVVSRIFKNAKQSCSFPIAGNVQATCGRRSWGGIIAFNKNFHNNETCLTSAGEVPALQFQLAAAKIWRGSWTQLMDGPHSGANSKAKIFSKGRWWTIGRREEDKENKDSPFGASDHRQLCLWSCDFVFVRVKPFFPKKSFLLFFWKKRRMYRNVWEI